MRINEIFYSLQGEGHFSGTPAIFIRFSGCNLKCSFCDTDHSAFQEMNDDDIINEVKKYPAHHVVITGGEPTLQLTASLTSKLHELGYFIQIETNGTHLPDTGCHIDWTTCSPKYQAVVLPHIDELKVVYDGNDDELMNYEKIKATVYSLQPCDTKDKKQNDKNIQGAIGYCLRNPKWRLSLQTHKILGMR